MILFYLQLKSLVGGVDFEDKVKQQIQFLCPNMRCANFITIYIVNIGMYEKFESYFEDRYSNR